MKFTLFATAMACLSSQSVSAEWANGIFSGSEAATTVEEQPVPDLGCDTYRYFLNPPEDGEVWLSWDENTALPRAGDRQSANQPLYNGKGEVTGTYAETVELLPTLEILGKAVVTVTNKSGVQKGQVSYTGNRQTNPITGGTGMFACASGVQNFDFDIDREQGVINLQVCGGCS